MYRLTILYPPPADADAFRDYYLTVHLAIAKKMKGLTGWNLSWITDGAPYSLVAELYAGSEEAMTTILESPEGRAAHDDLVNFAPDGVVFLSGSEDQVALE